MVIISRIKYYSIVFVYTAIDGGYLVLFIDIDTNRHRYLPNKQLTLICLFISLLYHGLLFI